MHELARLYHDLGDSEREVEIYNRISAIDPADAEAVRLGKDASARGSMKSGGWGSGRELSRPDQRQGSGGVAGTAEPDAAVGRIAKPANR